MTAEVEGVMYLLKKGMHLNTKSRAGPVTVVKSTNSPVLDSGETSIKSIRGNQGPDQQGTLLHLGIAAAYLMQGLRVRASA